MRAAPFLNLFIVLKKRGPDQPSFRPITLEDPVVTKKRVVKAMADRCLAGEFDGSYCRAAKEPECVALGILHQHILYHMDQKRPLVAADRAADRARVAAEATAASQGTNPVFVFVERGGSASAATAVSAIVGKLECASAELEAAEEKTAEMKKRLQELKAGQSDREAEVRRFAKESAREIAHLQVLLAGEQKRADAAVAKKSVMSEAKDKALYKARMFQQSLTRLQEKLDVIEAKPSSSDPGMTCLGRGGCAGDGGRDRRAHHGASGAQGRGQGKPSRVRAKPWRGGQHGR